MKSHLFSDDKHPIRLILSGIAEKEDKEEPAKAGKGEAQ
jgi:hypothetical protein